MLRLNNIIFCVFLCGLVVGQEKCILPFGSHQHWDVFWPLVFKETGSLYPTETVGDSEAVVVPAAGKVIVSCGPNFLKKQNNVKNPLTKVIATCNNGKFESDAIQVDDVKDYRCDLRAIEEIIKHVDGCPDEKTSVNFGFVHPIDGMAHITGEACYDTKEGRTLFGHVRLSSEDSISLDVVDKNFFRQANPPSGYKAQFMKAFRLDELNERLRTLLKTQEIPSFEMARFVDDQLLWSPQLAATKKLAWNYLIRHENLFTIDMLKEDIRDIERNVDVYIGSHGVYTAKTSAGEKVPIYLDGEKFPVPAVVWIAVKREDSATAFVVFNDPDITETEVNSSSLCNSKCDRVSWLKRIRPNGVILCCEYDDLQKNIREMPQLNGIKRMLV